MSIDLVQINANIFFFIKFSLLLCLIGESFFGAAIHNLLHLLRSLVFYSLAVTMFFISIWYGVRTNLIP